MLGTDPKPRIMLWMCTQVIGYHPTSSTATELRGYQHQPTSLQDSSLEQFSVLLLPERILGTALASTMDITLFRATLYRPQRYLHSRSDMAYVRATAMVNATRLVRDVNPIGFLRSARLCVAGEGSYRPASFG